MFRKRDAESGFTLIETLIALSVLIVGALGMASVFSQGLKGAISSPNELIATQKAAEAVESVFSARDSHTLTWAQVRNVAAGGVFVDGATPMNLSGKDGILNTGDAEETLEDPSLAGFTRTVQIADLSKDLRVITVSIKYPAGSSVRTYTLTSYISAYA